jgi:hypothetical protein
VGEGKFFEDGKGGFLPEVGVRDQGRLTFCQCKIVKEGIQLYLNRMLCLGEDKTCVLIRF